MEHVEEGQDIRQGCHHPVLDARTRPRPAAERVAAAKVASHGIDPQGGSAESVGPVPFNYPNHPT